ncbi:MAG: hypothetical protein L0241_03255 [Planctomycetia bacterium]|nr:hypothetical protein [Planctomycetia bacterium]
MPAGDLTLEVTILTDVVDAGDGELSLREALTETNGTVPSTFHTIYFNSSLAGGTLTLSTADEYRQLEIRKDTIIDGPASKITIQHDSTSATKHRLFEIKDDATADLRDLNLRHGSVVGSGGGLFVNDSALLLTNCDVSNNTATASGGGISVIGSSASLMTSHDCDIHENGAGSGGAGIYAGSETNIILDDTKVRLNLSGGNGGGLFVLGNATLIGAEVYSNTAQTLGGGIFASPGATGTLRLEGGTEIHGNQLLNLNPALRKGGGIYLNTGTVSFGGEDDTIYIYDNSATTGDGMYRANGTTVVGQDYVEYTNDEQYDEPPP